MKTTKNNPTNDELAVNRGYKTCKMEMIRIRVSSFSRISENPERTSKNPHKTQNSGDGKKIAKEGSFRIPRKSFRKPSDKSKIL